MKILNFGSLNIDYVYKVNHFVKAGETQLSESLEVYPGGKGLNQSIALSRAGQEVYHCGKIGASDGDFLLEVLKSNNINVDNIIKSTRERTGNAIIQVDSSGQNCIILYGGANQSIEKTEIDSIISKFSKDDILLLQNEISNLDYIIKKAKEKGLYIVLNPSPINDRLIESDLTLIDLFIMNEIEAASILGLNFNFENNLGLLKRKVKKSLYSDKKLIITLGEKGSVFIFNDVFLTQKAFSVDVVDTTAAGDTFTGYFISELVNGNDFSYALEVASLAASIACKTKGAEPSVPYYEDVMKEYNEIN